jgi:non-specific serine/threonine protein kinase
MLTRFIGRKRELAALKGLLASSRLVTLTGAAGCGKTRLALRVAAEVDHQYADGVHWVELAPLVDPTLIPHTFARALNVAEQPGRPSLENLLDALHDQQLLLILDNCEHLLDECAQLAKMLLSATEISVLTTSREPLGTPGERLYPVAPLSLPPDNYTPDEIGQFDAIQLFVERARAVVPAFDLTPDNAAVVARICRKLDGIPLAIELASARMNVLTVEQIAARLDKMYGLLPPASPSIHSHHDTLLTALDWSHDLLMTAEQVMLRRLSVFAGSCSLASVEVVCAGDQIEPQQVLELLSSLVNKSLVVANTLQRREARYSLLETIRQYGQEKLIASSEQSALRDRHLQRFLKLTEEAEPKLRGEYQQLWLDWVEGEFDNIRAALTWSLESEHIEAGLRIVIAIYQFWTIRDYAEEGFAWIERLLAETDEGVALVVRANALSYAVNLAGFRGNAEAIEKYGLDAAVLVETAEGVDESALRWALAGLYYAARVAGDHQTEYTIAVRLIQLHRESGTSYDLAIALTIFSFSAMSVGKYDDARAMLDEGLPLLRELGNPYRIAMALNFSGDLARCEREYAEAQFAYEESISILREIDAVRDLASALHNLGHACLHRGDVERAYELFRESMAIHQTQGNTPGMGECLIGFAALAAMCGLPAAGARLLAAVVAIGGERVATAWAATRMEYEHYSALVRAILTESEFQAEQRAAQAFTLEQAVEYAQNVALQATAAQKTSNQADELTEREREVAFLIARARSNDEIAEELVLSKRTVEKHIANIRAKLGFTQRAEIVRWALENNPQSRDK